MKNYLFKRLGQFALAMALMSALVFVLARMTGDPVSLLLSEYSTEEDRTRIIQQLGLDQPLLVQYGIFVANAMQGDLGRSVSGDRQPALELVAERLPASMQLASVALCVSLLLGVPLGVLSAVNRGTVIDIAARLFALIGQSIPVFWLGIVFIYIFSVKLQLLPTSGFDGARSFVLPALTMGLFTVAAVARLVRLSMLDALGSEYVKLARIKGVSEAGVIWKHALRNSLIPVITFMGTFFANMITSAVVIETVFAWPGIGRLAFTVILNRDFPVMQAVVLVITALFISANLIVDIIYAAVDPRIRYGV